MAHVSFQISSPNPESFFMASCSSVGSLAKPGTPGTPQSAASVTTHLQQHVTSVLGLLKLKTCVFHNCNEARLIYNNASLIFWFKDRVVPSGSKVRYLRVRYIFDRAHF